MKIKITAFSFIVAASFGAGFSQAAKAEGEDATDFGNQRVNRFIYDSHTFILDHLPHNRRSAGDLPQSSVRSGVAPKNLLGLPSFISKPAPSPMVVDQSQAAVRMASNSPFSSLFGRPNPALVAQAGALSSPLAVVHLTPAVPLVAKPQAAPAAPMQVRMPHQIRPIAAHVRPPVSIANYEGKYYRPEFVPVSVSSSKERVAHTRLTGKLLRDSKSL